MPEPSGVRTHGHVKLVLSPEVEELLGRLAQEQRPSKTEALRRAVQSQVWGSLWDLSPHKIILTTNYDVVVETAVARPAHAGSLGSLGRSLDHIALALGTAFRQGIGAVGEHREVALVSLVACLGTFAVLEAYVQQGLLVGNEHLAIWLTLLLTAYLGLMKNRGGRP